MLGESEHKVQKLWANVEYLNRGFEELGFDIGHSETPIIPVRGCVGRTWVRGGEERAQHPMFSNGRDRGEEGRCVCWPLCVCML
jgi:hypothetical protein